MEDQIQSLWRLQEIDLTLGTLRAQQDTFGAALAQLKQEVAELEQVLTGLQAEIEKKRFDRQKIQHEIERLREMVKQSKVKQSQIKTNKEYFAALKEIETCEKEINIQETALLELMEEIDTLQSKADDQAKVLADKQEVVAVQEGSMAQRTAELDQEINGCAQERQAVVDVLNDRLLARYNRIRGRFANAVVRVENGTCMGCHVNVPPQVYINLLKGEDILNCPNCQRIMFCEPEKQD
ncbi:MAG: hypothetical protein JXO49_04430 [Deltaproteobacteria bacterium]|nr:hypothetical protein [Candidatus Anaeroferrophillus wilburensis]MBN2888575.1 hypothetical protein [Deltaproteobacteria bacterium]